MYLQTLLQKGIFIQVKCYFIKFNFLDVFPYVYNFRPNFSTVWIPFLCKQNQKHIKNFQFIQSINDYLQLLIFQQR